MDSSHDFGFHQHFLAKLLMMMLSKSTHFVRICIATMLLLAVECFHGKIAVIGSGSWGTAIARRVALNIDREKALQKSTKEREVKLWIYEEKINNRLLSDIINKDHVNPKYLPNVQLPSSLQASPNLIETCKDADMLLFVVPHQYLQGILDKLKGNIRSNAIGVSLIKGLRLTSEGPQLLSSNIKQTLGLDSIAVVMGANVASDVATDSYVEATVASKDLDVAKRVASILHCPEFCTELTTDMSTVELCGALKNVVAIGAGMSDGMKYGGSSKAALMRQGLVEMGRVCQLFDRTGNYKESTLLMSCGVADLIATCYGGRNHKCGVAFAQRLIQANSNNGGGVNSAATSESMWSSIEEELLNGQKLQGVDTCREVIQCLSATGHLDQPGLFPLFKRIHSIACEGGRLQDLYSW